MNGTENQIKLEVRGPSYGQLLIDLISSLIFNTYDVHSGGPRIVAINYLGAEYIVEEFKSMRRAKKALPQMHDELIDMGNKEWCLAHNLPPQFSHNW